MTQTLDDERLTSIGLASEGFGGGDPDVVDMMPVETVLQMAAFTKFQKEYLETKHALNKPASK